MKYTVKQFIDSNRFPQIKVISGEKYLEKEITGIRIIEVPEMAKYLDGGEILVTSLLVYKDCHLSEFKEYLSQYSGKFLSAIVYKKRMDDSNIKSKERLLKKYCEEQRIPFLEIPVDLDYWTIIKHIMNKVFDKTTARLKYFKLTHDNFNILSFTKKSNTNRAVEVLNLLGSMLGNPVDLYYSNGNCGISTDGNTNKLVLLDNLEDYKPDILTRYSYLRQRGRYTQYLVKIDIFGSAEVYLVVTEKNRELSLLDYMAIENAIVTLMYGFVSEFAQQEIEKKYNHDLVHGLLHNGLNHKELEAAVRILGLDNEQEYQVIVFQTRMDAYNRYDKEFLHEVGVIEGELVALRPNAMIFRNMERIVSLHKVNKGQTPIEFQTEMEELQQTIQKAILHRKSGSRLLIGIGKPVIGAAHLSDSYAEAEKALTYIDIARLVSGNAEKMVVQYANLGFFQILGDINESEQLLKYIPESLQILRGSDPSGELFQTLRIYLDNNQSLKKTSEIMFVHYRTVVYRIDKISKISGMNFKNTNEMLAVRIGLIIYMILEDRI